MTVYVRRFILRAKKLKVYKTYKSTAEELEEAEREWLSDLQNRDFILEYRLLRTGSGISSSRVCNLSLHIDSNDG